MKYALAVGMTAVVMFSVTALALATYLTADQILALLLAAAVLSVILWLAILLH